VTIGVDQVALPGRFDLAPHLAVVPQLAVVHIGQP
jgi:hypothetical protein